MTDKPDTTGSRIRRARLERGWSQQELGSRARLSISTINDVEAERADLRLGTLHAIALALDVPASELVGEPQQRVAS